MRTLFLFLFGLARLVSSRCECGYSVVDPDNHESTIYLDILEADFTHLTDTSENHDWVPQEYNVSAESGRGQYGKSFVPSNIVAPSSTAEDGSGGDPGLGLRVESNIGDGAISGAEIDTSRLDLHWGSYRAGMKVTAINGTCAAFFWYLNDTQEIDIEFLSREFNPTDGIYPINLVIQSQESREAGYDASKTGTFKRVNLTFDPTANFHEYRFDYTPNQVIFYADSQRIASMEGSSVPSVGGHLILQHWSNGNPKWSGGPPDEDAFLKISYVKAYFNSSDQERQEALSRRCRKAKSNDETLCIVPDADNNTTSSGGTFLGDDEENVGPRLTVTMLVLVMFCVGMHVLLDMGVGM